MPSSDDPLLSLTAQIVIAQVAHHPLRTGALPGLIRDVYAALAGAAPHMAVRPEAPRPESRNAAGTVFADHLVCMDCGLRMKMLKRHLQTVHRMTPAQYRAAWNLPPDYPMVAREYAALRSNLAKESGLGKRPVPRGR